MIIGFDGSLFSRYNLPICYVCKMNLFVIVNDNDGPRGGGDSLTNWAVVLMCFFEIWVDSFCD